MQSISEVESFIANSLNENQIAAIVEGMSAAQARQKDSSASLDEFTAERLAVIATQLDPAVNALVAASERTGTAALSYTAAIVGINAQLENGGPLVDLFGGNIETAVGYLQSIAGENETIEQAFQRLQQVQSSYYQKFYSQEERQAKIVEQARAQIDALNDSLSLFGEAAIDTKAEYRAHIESLELATEAGKRTATSMLELQDALLIVEEADRLAKAALTNISANAFSSDAIGAEEYSALTARAQAISDNYAAELALITDVHNQRIKQLQEEERIGKELLKAVESLLLSDLSPLTPQQRFLEAQSQFARNQVQAENGDLEAQALLQSSGQAYLKEAQSYYASGAGYQSIFGEVSGIFERFGESLASDNNLAEREAEINEKMFIEQRKLIDASEQELGLLALSVSALDNLELTSIAISELIEALPDQLSSTLRGMLELGTGNSLSGGAGNGAGSSDVDYISSIYESVLGRSADVSGASYWASQLASGSITRENMALAIKTAGIENGEIDGSHAKGLGFVPFDGYRAELHRGEMVLPAALANKVRTSNDQSPVMLSEVSEGLQALIQEVTLLRSERADDAQSAHKQRQRQISTGSIRTKMGALA
jgi:hypothetical protein